MAFTLSRWRPKQLLLAWGAYWITLGIVTLAPGILAAWRVTRPGAAHSIIAASLHGDVLAFTVSTASAPVWAGSTTLGALGLSIAGPPILLWIAWLLRRPRRGSAAEPTSPTANVYDTEAPALRQPGMETAADLDAGRRATPVAERRHE